MEDLNVNIMNMICNLQDLMMDQKENAAKMPDKDAYGYPFEPFDCFSTEPASFLEKAMILDSEAVDIFKQLRSLNRHSPLFYRMSADMEKIVSQLGSACITKAVIEQQGQNSASMDQLLDKLNIDHLREWTAFNLRKCFASYMESSSVLRYNRIALSLSLRWSALDRRLLATAERIEKIKSGQVKVDLTDKAEELKQTADPEKKTHDTEKSTAPLRDTGRALPVDKAAVRDTLAEGLQDINPAGAEEEISEAEAQDPITEEIPVPAEEAVQPEPDAFAEDEDEDFFYDEDEDEIHVRPTGNQEWMRDMAVLFSDPALAKWAVSEYAAPP